MTLPSADIITKTVDPSALPSTLSRVVDIQPDPRGGYFALVDVSPAPHDTTAGYLLKFDDTHNLIASWIFGVADLQEPQYNVMSVAAMSVGPAGIFIVGTVSADRGSFYTRAFVLKLSLDATRQWARVYRPLLVNGCRVPYDFHTRGRGIERLPVPDNDKLMVVFQTSVLSDGRGLPPTDDAVGAMIFTIDDNGDATSEVTRIFGRGQLLPMRLRVLPSFGPTIVGTTRFAHPLPETWMPFWMRVDRDGNIVAEHAYEFQQRDAVLNDIAEGAGQTLAVGSFEPAQGSKMALGMHIDAAGALFWAAEYGPPVGAEFFSSELDVVRALDDEFLAGGSVNTSGSQARPWLLRLQAAAPDPVWQKRYDVNAIGSTLVSAFYTLLFNVPNRVIAGGNIIRRQIIGPTTVTDRIPFFAVSQTEPGIAEPKCSAITMAVAQPLNPRQLPGTDWMDRMRCIHRDWFPSVVAVSLLHSVICPSQTPP